MSRRPGSHLAAMLTAVLLTGGQQHGAWAEENVDASSPYSATARLAFTVDIGKFLYFRVGSAGSTIDTVAFTLAPAIPPQPTLPAAGSGVPLAWNGAPPAFAISATGNALPVEVHSNAGTVSLRAVVDAGLSSGAHSIPMNALSIASNNPALPAPPVPASGTGAPVSVAGSAFANLVTQRSATWTFALASGNYPAGAYSGALRFTASAP